jgi:DNA-binding transcriptional ArsR family regulator
VRADLSGEESDILRGTTLQVYRFLLKTGKPVGAREVYRALNLSSPSVATYHLSKLEDACLVKREGGNYAINKLFLENSIRISHFLIPKYLFYSILALTFLTIELTLLRPPIITYDYFFFTFSTATLAFLFCYETAKAWIKGSL